MNGSLSAKHILTEAEATSFFAKLYRGVHHIPDEKIRDEGNGCWSVAHYGGMSTFDFDELTRLVLLAHERCVRAWVTAGRPRYVRIWIAGRVRDTGDIVTSHPTIEQALAKFRARDDEPWWRELEKKEPT